MQYVYQFLSPTGNVQIVDYRTAHDTGDVDRGQRGDRADEGSATSRWMRRCRAVFSRLSRGRPVRIWPRKTLSHIRYELKPPMEVDAGRRHRAARYGRLLQAAAGRGSGLGRFSRVRHRDACAAPLAGGSDVSAVRSAAGRARTGLSRAACPGLWLVCTPQGTTRPARRSRLSIWPKSRCAARRPSGSGTSQRRAIPSVVHKLGAMLDMYDPRIPDAWLDRLIYGPTNIAAVRIRGLSPGRRAAPGRSLCAGQTPTVPITAASGWPMHEAGLPLGMR